MALTAVVLEPGICKSMSSYAASKATGWTDQIAHGRWVTGNYTRFVAGFPEKLAGWVNLNIAAILGVPRAMLPWRDTAGNSHMAVGTSAALYVWDGSSTAFTDITPQRTLITGTLTNPFTVTAGSTTVTVADTSQNVQNGDWVYLSAASSVGGLVIAGWYSVQSRTSAGYTITSAVAAASTASGAGGATQTSYPRVQLALNPFTGTAGSTKIVVNHPGHGARTGDIVHISGAETISGFGALTYGTGTYGTNRGLFGSFTVNGAFPVTVIGSNAYSIVAALPYPYSGAFGGAAVSATFNISFQNLALPFSAGGYGVGTYGTGAYNGSSPAPPFALGWTLDAYGGLLEACQIGGTLYFYDPITGGRAYPILNAPNNVLASFVTPERFIVALGTSSSSLQIAWCDQSDPTQWVTTATNTANTGRTLQGGSYLVGGIACSNGVSYLATNRDIFIMQYIGTNSIYATPKISDNSGLISPWAVTVLGEVAYWMGSADFWQYNGNTSALPSDDVREFVFGNMNPQFVNKTVAGSNRAKREVWFFYVSNAATEIDSYVIYHTDQQCWSVPDADYIPTLQRTAWCDAHLFSTPYGMDSSGNLYQHETGTDSAGSPMPATLTSSMMDVSDGSPTVYISGFVPDVQRISGALNLVVNTAYYPMGATSMDGTTIPIVAMGERYDLRDDGKLFGFSLTSSQIGGDFRLGQIRIEVAPQGNRS